MCIRVENIFPKKAKTDIVCYKLLKEDMTAPYTGFQYDFKEYKANGLFVLLKDIKNFIIEKPYFFYHCLFYIIILRNYVYRSKKYISIPRRSR